MVGQTGLWSTTWLFFAFLTLVSLTWMHLVIRKMTGRQTARQERHMDVVSAAERVLVSASSGAADR